MHLGTDCGGQLEGGAQAVLPLAVWRAEGLCLDCVKEGVQPDLGAYWPSSEGQG